MSGVRRMNVNVGAEGRVEVRVPDWPTGQPVEVTVRRLDLAEHRRSVKDILQSAPGRLMFRTTLEVDTYIRGERDAWES